MKFAKVALLVGLFTFVFSAVITMYGAVYAGEGGGPPEWCYWGDPYEPYGNGTTMNGQCCIYNGVRGEWEDVNPAEELEDWVCNCVGIYEGPLIWNPCGCDFSCGSWPE